MLFDLRGRGRRRTVQIVYIGLVCIFLLGFLGLGVGVGGGGGGILNFFTEGKSSGGATFAAKVEAAQARTRSHPNDPAAWEALAKAQLHQASEPEYITVSGEREGPNAKGLALLAQVARSWETYLRLKPPHPNSELGQQMANLVYDELDLNRPADEARALKIAIAGQPPSAGLYSKLAAAAYKARHIAEGDAALRKALPLIPAEERKKAKKYLEELRKNPLAHVPVTVNKLPNGTYVATQAGKTATVKKTGKGTFTGIGNKSATTPPPAGTTSTAAKKK